MNIFTICYIPHYMSHWLNSIFNFQHLYYCVLHKICLTLFTRKPSLRITFVLSVSILLSGILATELCLFLPARVIEFFFFFASIGASPCSHPNTLTPMTHTLLNTGRPIQSCTFCQLSHEGALTPSDAQHGWQLFGKKVFNVFIVIRTTST